MKSTNPFSLLSRGGAFINMANRGDHYKFRNDSPLPKFSGGRRMASAPAMPGPSPAPCQTGQATLFAEPVAPTPAPAVEPVKIPIILEAPVIPAQSASPVIPPSPAKSPFAAEKAKPSPKLPENGFGKAIALFFKRLGQRFILGRKGRPVHGATVQTELALDKVTPLRNNLDEDDDLEVVVLVERKVGTGKKPLASLSKMEMPTEAWNKLTAPFRKKSIENAFSPKAAANRPPELSAQA